ncbi:MAG: hypothetical protein K0Q94_5589 [Paenibacillus sp.]|uniref:hypothetical protein n=1 Tax=Paenibacillus sp. GCM10012303 TaxID=3317340 RepID=UPI0029F1BD80|nr:hypothetical protein [Paenibacillus sp.]
MEEQEVQDDAVYEGRDKCDMDIDRMINEGLGGGNITMHNGLIENPEEYVTGEIEEDLS